MLKSHRTGFAATQVAIVTAAVAVLIAVGVAFSSSPLPTELPAPAQQPHFSADGTTLDTMRVEVPMVVEEGRLIVHAWINGQGPHRLLVDTGCSFPLALDVKLAEELALPTLRHTSNSDGAGSEELRPVVAVASLDLGGARFEPVEALVDSIRALAEDDAQFDGCIGFPIFRDVLTSIDLAGEQLIFERGTLDAGAAHTVPYVDWQGLPHVPVDIGGTSIRALIDTGSSLALTLPFESRERIGTRGDVRRAGVVRTLYAELDWWRGELAEPCTIAGQELNELDVHFFKPTVDPAIGSALLENFIVSIDSANELVAFKPRER